MVVSHSIFTASLETIVKDYQQHLRHEKRLLLNFPEGRREVLQEVKHLLAEGKLRSVKRSALHDLITILEAGRPLTEEEKESILTIPFSPRMWLAVREAVKPVANAPMRQASAMVVKHRNHLIEKHIRLVEETRCRVFRKVPDHLVEDLDAEGFLGLIHGLETFDESKGGNLTAHLQNWIVSYQRRLLRLTEYSKSMSATKKKKGADEFLECPKGKMLVGMRLAKAYALAGSKWDPEETEDHLPVLISYDAAYDSLEATMLTHQDSPYHMLEAEEGARAAERLKQWIEEHDGESRLLFQAYYPSSVHSDLTGPLVDVPTAVSVMQEQAALNLIAYYLRGGNGRSTPMASSN